MYARLVTLQLAPETIDDAIELYRDSVMPAAQQEPGFKGGRLLVDRATSKAISVVLWATEADILETGAGSAYFQEQIAKFGQLFTAPPVAEHYEIAVFVG
jgi:heme-degrading monooxygenase HmoA